jgi:hypothetical protein
VLNTPGSLYFLALNIPGSRVCDFPVMNTSGSRDSSKVNTLGGRNSPVVNTPGGSKLPGSEYTGESPVKSNNSSIIAVKSKLFLG